MWFFTGIQVHQLPWSVEQNFNNTFCSLLKDDFKSLWAYQCTTENDNRAQIFIILSQGYKTVLLEDKDIGQPEVIWKKS